MPDYNLGKIYILQSPHTDQCYIGSTTQPRISARMSGHRTDAKRGKGCSSKIIIAAGDAFITLIENYPCTDKGELNRKEGEIGLDYPTKVNIQVAGRTRKESMDAYNNKPERKSAEKTRQQTPAAKAVKKAYYQSPAGKASSKATMKTYNNKPEIIALKSTREYKDQQNKMAQARRDKKRDAKKAAALLIV
jgi:hypothetical protein